MRSKCEGHEGHMAHTSTGNYVTTYQLQLVGHKLRQYNVKTIYVYIACRLNQISEFNFTEPAMYMPVLQWLRNCKVLTLIFCCFILDAVSVMKHWHDNQNNSGFGKPSHGLLLVFNTNFAVSRTVFELFSFFFVMGFPISPPPR